MYLKWGGGDTEIERLRAWAADDDPAAVKARCAGQPLHVIARGSVDKPDASMGFILDMPDHAYNHGEIYNLSIAR